MAHEWVKLFKILSSYLKRLFRLSRIQDRRHRSVSWWYEWTSVFTYSRKYVKWLVRSARPHDSLFFHCMSFNLFIRTRHLMTRRLWTWWPSQRSGRRWSRWLWPRFPIYRNVFGTSSQLYTVIFPLDYKKEGVILDDVWTPVWCLKYSNSCTGPT